MHHIQDDRLNKHTELISLSDADLYIDLNHLCLIKEASSRTQNSAVLSFNKDTAYTFKKTLTLF